MKTIIIDEVVVSYQDGITEEELLAIASEEMKLWEEKEKELARVEITLDGENIIVKTMEKSPVRRVRRITGYLSQLEKFNDAKQAELAQRLAHV